MTVKHLLIECEKESARNRETIAELKKTVEQYRILADLSPDCILIIDREFLIRYVNAAAGRYLGMEPHRILGRPLSQFFPPAVYRSLTRHCRQVFGSGAAVTSTDNVSFPGIRLLLHTKWVPLWDSARTISSVLSISREMGTPRAASAEPRRLVGESAHILSNREVQVLRLIADGMTNREIAERLFISAKTVETHRARMMKKMDVHNAPGLIRKSKQAGLVE